MAAVGENESGCSDDVSWYESDCSYEVSRDGTAFLDAYQDQMKEQLEFMKLLISNEACRVDQSLKDILRLNGCEHVLHLACNLGNLEMVELMLSKGADVNEEDAYGHQPLEIATRKGHFDIVKILVAHGANKDRGVHAISQWNPDKNLQIVRFLLSRGANVDYQDEKHRWTLLHIAANHGWLEMVEFLLSCGADANLKNSHGELPLVLAFRREDLKIEKALLKNGKSTDGIWSYNPLHGACRQGDLEMVQLLLSKGANPNEQDPEGRTPCHYACEDGHIEVVQLLLSNGAELVHLNETGEDVISPLFFACKGGHLDIVKLLLAHGARVSPKHREGTPLHAACYGANLEIVKLLLSNGASVEEQSKFSGTPLHVASRKGNLEIVNFLLSTGARADCQDARRDTPLHLASECRRHEVIELLLSSGATTNIQNDSRRTPLHDACVVGSPEIVQLLLSNGAGVDTQDAYGHTPLHLACMVEDEETVDILLSYKADADVKDNQGRLPLYIAFHGETHNIEIQKKLLIYGVSIDYDADWRASPLHAASRNGTLEIVELLLSKGANVNETDHSKSLPLQYACEEGHLETAQILVKHGAFLDGGDLEGTPLMRACKTGHISIVHMLLNEMVNTNVLSASILYHPLIRACRADQFEIVELLLNYGAKVNIPNGYGNFPLHFAVSDEVARILILNGADGNAANRKGETALTCRFKAEELRCIKVLLDYGVGRGRQCLRDDCSCQCQTSELMCAYWNLRVRIDKNPCLWGFNEGDSVFRYQVNCFERYIIQTMVAGKSLKSEDTARDALLMNRDQKNRDHFEAICKSELSLMKKTTVNNTDIPYYDLLIFNITPSKYQQVLENFSIEECLRVFPIYGDMTVSKYLAVHKHSLIEQSIPFFILTQPRLPPECARDIMTYLSAADLNTLVEFC